MEAAATRVFEGARGLTAFHDAISATLVDQRVEPAVPERFSARLRSMDVGGIALVDSRVSALRARRETTGDAEGSVFLLTATTADGEIVHRRGREVVRPNRMVVIPGGETFDVGYRFATHVSFVVIPAPLARVRFADLDGPIRSVDLGPVGRILLDQLTAIKRAVHGLGADGGAPDVVERLAATVLDALADEARSPRHGGTDAVRVAAERLIDRHLRDPRLDAAFVARRLGVSRRTLHRAFEGDGVAPTIRARRLDEAARRLSGDRGATVSELAAELGFGSASRFAALFRDRYGRSPRDFRSA